MGRFKITYPRQRDPASEARNQAGSQATIQRQAQASAYAAARFNEWQANAQQRQESLQYRNQILQSQAELAGIKQMSDLYDQAELHRQTKMYFAGKPVLLEQLKNAGIKPGSPEYSAEIAAFAQHIPDAFTHVTAIQQDLNNLSKTDETAAHIVENLKTQRAAQAAAMGLTEDEFGKQYRVKDVVTGKGGHTVYERQNDIPQQVLMRYGKLAGDIDEYKDSDKARASAAQKEKAIFEAKYPSLSALVPATPEPSAKPTGPTGVEAATAYGQTLGAPTANDLAVATPSPTPQPTPAAIETGARRTINGQLAEWDGQGWSAVQQ